MRFIRPHTLPSNVYYGWYIVVGLSMVSLVSVSMAGINFGFFIRPMQDSLGINESMFGLAQSARYVGFAVTSFMIGRMIDRFGSRWPLAIVGLIAGGLVACIAFIEAGWQMVAIFFALGLIGFQGAGGNLYSSVPISRWFQKKRGKAMSAVFLGVPAGILLTPLIAGLISAWGWRLTFVATGLVGAFVIVTIAVVVIRRSPEDMGLGIDGGNPQSNSDSDQNAGDQSSERSWTRVEAIRNSSFWKLLMIQGCQFVAFGTIVSFRIPYFEDNGIPREVIGLAFSLEAVTSVAAAIPAGIALDRFPPRLVGAISLLIMSVAIASSMLVGDAWQVFVATGLFGLGAASGAIVWNTIWPNYFGSQHIGEIRGRAMQLMLPAALVGGPLAGYIKDSTGSYIPAWWIAIGLLLVAAITMVSTKAPVIDDLVP